MKILFDLISTQPIGDSKFHGGSEYGKIVFFQLSKSVTHQEITCIFDENRPLDDRLKNVINECGFSLVGIQNLEDINEILKKGNFDKFYSPLPYQLYNIEFNNTEFIYTIHGLRSIEMPTDYFEYKYVKNLRSLLVFIYKRLFTKRYIDKKAMEFEKLIRNKNSRIIVPSNHTKFSLMNQFPFLKANQIKVLYSPRKSPLDSNVNDSIIEKKYNIKEKNYLLLISGGRWIKNSYRAIKAIDELFSSYPDLKQDVLVLGVKNEKIFKGAIKNKSKFKFMNYVDEVDLELLYKNAFLFVYPTLNEGFGYPPLEAMKYGTPVAASAISSVTEVCGDGVIYFNPYSVEEIKNRILSVFHSKEIRLNYTELGIKKFEEVSQKQDLMLDELVNIILN